MSNKTNTPTARQALISPPVQPKVRVHERRRFPERHSKLIVTVQLRSTHNSAFGQQREAIESVGFKYDSQVDLWLSGLASKSDTRLLLDRLEELGIEHGINPDTMK